MIPSDIVERLNSALIHRYVVERELGRGGMATVYLARDIKHGRHVAVKVLAAEFATSVGVERFLGEIRAAARLMHPHILAIHDSGEADGLLYYIMPYVQGVSLRDLIAHEGRLSVPDAVRLAVQVCQALSHAHASGIIHRDIKPENILLTNERHACVADFGLSRALYGATSNRLTEIGLTLGSPSYMSPEQAGGANDVDGRSDIYSLGCVLYEMLEGEPPFKAATTQAVLAKHMTERPAALRPLRPDIPLHVDRAIAKALAKAPAERFATATDFANALTAQPGAAASIRPEEARLARVPRLMRVARRPRNIAVLAVVIASIAVAVWPLGREGDQPGGVVAVSAPGAIAVMPCSVHGSSEYAYLSEGMVDLLSTGLDGAGEWRTVDPHALLTYIQQLKAKGVAESMHAASVSERFATGFYVLCDVFEAATRLRIIASLYKRNAGSDPVVEASVDGAASQLLSLVDELSTELLIRGTGKPADRAIRAAPTKSLPALKAYLVGEKEFRAARYDRATDAFSHAVEQDPSFALAYYRLSAASEWNFDFMRARRAAGLALRNRERLPDRHARLFEAWYNYLHGDAERAEQQYTEITTNHPDDVEAWAGLGETLVHHNPVRGRPTIEAARAFERALALDPEYGEARFHMLEFAARRGDSAAFDSLVVHVDSTSTQYLSWHAVRAFGWGSSEDRNRILLELKNADEKALGIAVGRVASQLHDFEGAERLARLLAGTDRTNDWRAAAQMMLAQLNLARGRWQDAKSNLSTAEQLERSWALELRGLFSAMPLLKVPHTELSALRDSIQNWDPDRLSPNMSFFFAPHAETHAHLRLYLLGLLSARLRDADSAEQHARALEKQTGIEDVRLGPSLASSVRAHLAHEEGDSRSALLLLEDARIDAAPELVAVSPFYSRLLDRWLIAEIHRKNGATESALRWYASLGDGYDFVFAALGELGKAQTYDAIGRRAEAATAYGRFVELWSSADPELQPLVHQARNRLTSLAQESDN